MIEQEWTIAAARKALEPPVTFDDPVQISAAAFLRRIAAARERIFHCTECLGTGVIRHPYDATDWACTCIDGESEEVLLALLGREVRL